MKIDKKLNLVSHITREDGEVVYLHVTPLPYEVVEENCLLLGNLFTSFISQVGGLGAARVAAMMLRKKLKQEQEARRDAGLASGPSIADDIHRMTNVVYCDTGKWKTIPLDTALKQEIVTADEYREVEGEVVFFMVSSAIQKSELIAPTVGSVIGMYGGQLTPSGVTAFRDSLLTLSQDTDTQNPNPPPETSFIPS
ncbi:hypothetical protein ACIPSD_04530 [Pectobacterium sp. CHL-2024]|uniref:hypothetical protein n=1 Tax=Pectobacterium sp. CHL-2024 TaxID=3377079 RepID=UPI0037F1D75F